MSFHVACTFTCQPICSCKLGAPPGPPALADRLQQYFTSPQAFVSECEILVPRLPSQHSKSQGLLESTPKPVKEVLQTVQEDEEDDDQAAADADCRLCDESRTGGHRTCPSCQRRYHAQCIRELADNRDCWNWADWICPACSECNVCKRLTDPEKLLFCKKCDKAVHFACCSPPWRARPPGPFLCKEHVQCWACHAKVPGSGSSCKWFLGHTLCDACGRLFFKKKYCPVCLKVYRGSQTEPMVCCDKCEHWVHCSCDNIDDSLYAKFQADSTLKYICPACKSKVPRHTGGLEGAIRLIWDKKTKVENWKAQNSVPEPPVPPSPEPEKEPTPPPEDPPRETATEGPPKAGNPQATEAEPHAVEEAEAKDEQEDKEQSPEALGVPKATEEDEQKETEAGRKRKRRREESEERSADTPQPDESTPVLDRGRRQRVPSSKLRDMDTSVKRRFKKGSSPFPGVPEAVGTPRKGAETEEGKKSREGSEEPEDEDEGE